MKGFAIGLVVLLGALPASATDHTRERSAVITPDQTAFGDDSIPLSTVSEQSARPLWFSVPQNYPNPFNATTTIAFDLPREAGVHVSVYNSLGRKVRTLVDEIRYPGRIVLEWDGRDDQGELLGSGLYVYVVAADDLYAIRKMILLK